MAVRRRSRARRTFGRAGVGGEEFEASFSGKTDLTLRAAAWETARWLLRHHDAVWFGRVGALGAPDPFLLVCEETFKWAARMIDDGRGHTPDAVPAAAR